MLLYRNGHGDMLIIRQTQKGKVSLAVTVLVDIEAE